MLRTDKIVAWLLAVMALPAVRCSAATRSSAPDSSAPDSSAPDSSAPDSSAPDSSADGGFATAPHTPYPQIATGGGPTLGSVEVVSVSFQGDSHTPDLTAFLDWMTQSTWLSQVAGEYGVQGISQHVHVDLPEAAPTCPADQDVRALLAAKIADGTLPSAQGQEPSFLYLVFFPDGSSVSVRTGGDACSDIPGNGYHDTMDGTGPNVPYIVVPACDPRFSAILSELQGMELETARLLVDAFTDPSPRDEPAYVLTDSSNPWTAMGPELGDFCWGRLTRDGSYTMQRVYSDKAAARGDDPCVPAPAGSVPFGMSTSPAGLQTLQVGVPFAFTVTGWSAQPVPDWSFQATPWVGDYAVEVVQDKSTLNNGETTTVHVTVPYAVPSGTYGTARLEALSGSDSPVWPVAFVVR